MKLFDTPRTTMVANTAGKKPEAKWAKSLLDPSIRLNDADWNVMQRDLMSGTSRNGRDNPALRGLLTYSLLKRGMEKVTKDYYKNLTDTSLQMGGDIPVTQQDFRIKKNKENESILMNQDEQENRSIRARTILGGDYLEDSILGK